MPTAPSHLLLDFAPLLDVAVSRLFLLFGATGLSYPTQRSLRATPQPTPSERHSEREVERLPLEPVLGFEFMQPVEAELRLPGQMGQAPL